MTHFFLLRDMQHPAFKQGLLAILPASPGIAAWGLMTGVAMTNAGLSTVETVAMAVLVFAGSAQLAALPLLLAGAPMWVILATAFCVNLRFVVFSAHLRPYLMHLPLPERLLRGYLCADLSYMLFVKRFVSPSDEPEQRAEQLAFLSGNSAWNWLSWSVPSLAGIALAKVVPLSWGLGFAGILALLGIMGGLLTSRLRFVALAVAGAVAIATYALPLKLNIVVAIGLATVCCLIMEQTRNKPDAGKVEK